MSYNFAQEEEELSEWWFKLTDHKYYSNDQKREILDNYVIGDVLSSIRPDYNLPMIPKTLRIAMCGVSTAGTTSLIVTMKTAAMKGTSVMHWMNDNENHEHLFLAGKKGKAQMLIELVDYNRWMQNPTHEVIEILEGRKAPTHYGNRFNKQRHHLCILVIPSDLSLDRVDKYIELRNLVKLTNIPILHIFTKLDLPNAKANVSALKAKLGPWEHAALELTCYNRQLQTDEEINSQALFALLRAIMIADSKGLPVNHERQLAITRAWLGYGLVLVIILLVPFWKKCLENLGIL